MKKKKKQEMTSRTRNSQVQKYKIFINILNQDLQFTCTMHVKF